MSGLAGCVLFAASACHAAYITSEAGYHGYQVAANFRSVSAAANVFVGDDDVTTFTLPFAFNFYGRDYAAGSSGWVSVNGLLGFDTANAADYCCNSSMSVGSPANTVQAGWFDLYGSIAVQTDGAPGNRELIFTWSANEYDDNSAGAPNQFQAILHETSNDVEFQIATLNALLHYASVGGIKGDDTTQGLNFVDFEQDVRLANVGLLITTGAVPAGAVPEPGSLALLGLGLGSIALSLRRPKRARAA